MATAVYFGPTILVTTPGIQTWWFHHGAWKPDDWLRASMNARHPRFAPQNSDECGAFPLETIVKILEQWTETRTIEECGFHGGPYHNRGSVSIVHWVRFDVSPGKFGFPPVTILPRFVVHS